jgi:hypothetical protein
LVGVPTGSSVGISVTGICVGETVGAVGERVIDGAKVVGKAVGTEGTAVDGLWVGNTVGAGDGLIFFALRAGPRSVTLADSPSFSKTT